MVPAKVRERDKDLFLLVADSAEVSAQIPQSRARVNDSDAIRVGERDLQAGGVAAELLKAGIGDGNGSPRTIELELHRIEAGKGSESSVKLSGIRPFISGIIDRRNLTRL